MPKLADPAEEDLPVRPPKEVELPGVLQEKHHQELFRDIDRYAREAGIKPDWIWEELKVSDEEETWFRHFHRHQRDGSAGLLYVGRQPKAPMETRMAALTGALTRNFIFARLLTLHQLIEAVLAGEPPLMSCVLVPNFFTGDVGLPGWRSAVLLDALLQRQARGLQTVLYVSDLKEAGKVYGTALFQHLEAHYQQLAA